MQKQSNVPLYGSVTHYFSVRRFICLIVFVAFLWVLFMKRPPLLLRLLAVFHMYFCLFPTRTFQGLGSMYFSSSADGTVALQWGYESKSVCSLKTGDALYVNAKLIA